MGKKIVKIYRLPLYEHAVENVLNMFLPDEQQSFEECENERQREHHIFLSLLKLENMRRQKHEAEATKSVQKMFDNTEKADAKQIAKYKRKSRRLQNLTNAKWRRKNAKRHGLVLLECVDCNSRSELQTQDKSDYVFWMKTTTHPAGECSLCQGKETAIAAIP